MVSVILPTYNRAELLKETIDSVLEQTYADLELIIVDDGSEDETPALVSSIADSRIRYFKLDHTGYVGRVRNFGIKQSAGTYIAFVDSDDIWKPNKLERQVPLLDKTPGAGFCITDVSLFEGNTIVQPRVYHQNETWEGINIFHLLKRNRFLVYPSTFVFKRECLDKTGWLNEDIMSSDYNFNIRMSYFYQALVIYEPLVLRRMHPTNRHQLFSVQNYYDYVTTYEFLFRNKMIQKRFLNKAKSNACYKIGEIYRSRGDIKAARAQYLQALRYKPLFPLCYRQILSSYLKPQNQQG